MSVPEIVPGTEAQQILLLQQATAGKVDQLTGAVNGLGSNVQWIVDNVQQIFQTFQSPAFMQMLPGMMSGANSVPEDDSVPEDTGADDSKEVSENG